MVKVWILIQRDGVVLNRRRRYRNDGNVGTGSQCTGINSADARAQMYCSVSNGRKSRGYHNKLFAHAVTFAVDVDGAAGGLDHAC